MNEPLIDVNVYLGQWPTRRLPGDDPQSLAARLRERGVVEAWAGSFDGIFHKDPSDANARLAQLCREQTAIHLIPFGEINPRLPDWEQELERCGAEHAMPGIRLHPNYHGYTLDEPAFAKLLAAAAERNLIVALTPLMEDARMMHPLIRVPEVNLKPLAKILQQTKGLRLLLLNTLRRAGTSLLQDLIAAGDVCFDIGMLEGVAGLENVLDELPLERVLFGSYSPSFYFESALLKLRESPLGHHQRRAIGHDNARRLLPTVRLSDLTERSSRFSA